MKRNRRQHRAHAHAPLPVSLAPANLFAGSGHAAGSAPLEHPPAPAQTGTRRPEPHLPIFDNFDSTTRLAPLTECPFDLRSLPVTQPLHSLSPITPTSSLDPQADPRWIWPGRIRRGEVTLLAGDMLSGKSFLACDLAARLSAGLPLPDAPPDAPRPAPAEVLLVVGFETHPEVLQERLARLEADASRVHVLRIMQEETKDNVSLNRNFSLERDLGVLANHLHFNPAVQLIILDSFDRLAGTRFSPTIIRRLLTRLQVLAASSGAAILVTKSYAHVPRPGRHLRALGSSVYGDSLRSIWAIEQPALDGDPDDGDNQPTHRLVPLKLNDCERSTSLDFTLRQHRVEWLGPPRDCSTRHHGYDPAQARRREERSAVAEARDFLQALLGEGPLPSFQVRQQSDRAGLGWRTVQRAKQQLEIISRMSRVGREQSWTWWLPGTPPVRSSEAAMLSGTTQPGTTQPGATQPGDTGPVATGPDPSAKTSGAKGTAAPTETAESPARRHHTGSNDWFAPQSSLELGAEPGVTPGTATTSAAGSPKSLNPDVAASDESARSPVDPHEPEESATQPGPTSPQPGNSIGEFHTAQPGELPPGSSQAEVNNPESGPGAAKTRSGQTATDQASDPRVSLLRVSNIRSQGFAASKAKTAATAGGSAERPRPAADTPNSHSPPISTASNPTATTTTSGHQPSGHQANSGRTTATTTSGQPAGDHQAESSRTVSSVSNVSTVNSQAATTPATPVATITTPGKTSTSDHGETLTDGNAAATAQRAAEPARAGQPSSDHPTRRLSKQEKRRRHLNRKQLARRR